MDPASGHGPPSQLPRSLAPQKAISGRLPVDGEGWVYEIKWDGMRALAFVEQGRLRLQSANLADITATFPELAPLGDALSPHTVLLDGEIVATDEEGRPNFGLLQQRIHVTDPTTAARRASTIPVAYEIFDLLHLDGTDTTELPYTERRRLLEKLVEPGPAWSVPPAWHGDGEALMEAVRERGMEGLVAKRENAPYRVGTRSSTWRKVKARRRQEFVVGGWRTGEGSRKDRLGSLLVGYHSDGHLAYAGRVGTGYTEDEIDRLVSLLGGLARRTCPFHPPPPSRDAQDARWVEPELVVEVGFAEWTRDGRLRHPAYLGQRTDKPAAGVVLEPDG